MTDKIELPADELAKAITSVLPHAGTDKTLPSLCQVHLEANPAAAYLTATDRYTMGRYRIAAPEREPFPRLSVGIENADAKAVLKLAQNRAKLVTDRMPVTFEIDADLPTPRVTVSDGIGNSLSFLANDGQFPKVEQILQTAAENAQNGEPAICHGYNGKFLARFEKAAERHQAVWTYATEMIKPVLVTIGENDNFAGVIMTVKPAEWGVAPKLPDWVAHPYHDHPDKAVA